MWTSKPKGEWDSNRASLFGVVKKFTYKPAIIKWCSQYTYKVSNSTHARPHVCVWRIYSIFFFLLFFTHKRLWNKKKILRKRRRKKLIPIFLEISSFFNSSSVFLAFYFAVITSLFLSQHFIFRKTKAVTSKKGTRKT